MNLLSSTLSSISLQARVKYISLSLIGVSVVTGITYEEMSGAQISGLLSKLGVLIPSNDNGGGGGEIGKEISSAFSGIGKALVQGAEGIYWLGKQVVQYSPQAFDTIKDLYLTGKKYVDGSKKFETKWSAVNEQLKNDTTTVITNWARSLGNLERLWNLIKLPWTIVVKLKKVEVHTGPKEKPPKKPEKLGQEVWTKKEGQEDEKICWECFWVVLQRPRRSLKELGKMNKDAWKIYPSSQSK